MGEAVDCILSHPVFHRAISSPQGCPSLPSTASPAKQDTCVKRTECPRGPHMSPNQGSLSKMKGTDIKCDACSQSGGAVWSWRRWDHIWTRSEEFAEWRGPQALRGNSPTQSATRQPEEPTNLSSGQELAALPVQAGGTLEHL